MSDFKNNKEDCNNSEEESLLKTEEKIKSLAYEFVEPRESFYRELWAKIMARQRQTFSMKIFQPKILVPAFSCLTVIILAVVIYNYGPTNSFDKILAKLNFKKQTNQTTQVAENDSLVKGGKKLFSFILIKPVFAEFQEINQTVIAVLSGEKVKLSEIYNLDSFKDASFQKNLPFTDTQKAALEENNFFITDNKTIGDQTSGQDDFVDTYVGIGGSQFDFERKPYNSVFITSDYALHLYHILIDRSFQKIEEEKLQPRLKEMTQVLYDDSLKNYRSTDNQNLKDSYQRLTVYYLVPLAILSADKNTEVKQLNPSDFQSYAEYMDAQDAQNSASASENPDIMASFSNLTTDLNDQWIHDTAEAELKLIASAKTIAPSPLFTPLRTEFLNDYTQFTPRSHYTENKILKTYFMAMTWYGRMGFALKSPEQTRDALIITGQINTLKVGDKNLADLWSDTDSLIDFFVGESDDLTPVQYTVAMKNIFGDEATDVQIADNKTIDAFKAEALKSLVTPKILSEAIISDSVPEKTKEELLADTMQFRFMGQRFTPDAYILGKLTQGDEKPDAETGQRLPSMATSLMPISVLSPANNLAKNYFNSWVAKNFPDSTKVVAKVVDILTKEFSALPENTWNQNIYWGWLSTYRSLLGGYFQGYPYFMKTEAWQKKNLGDVLGSYTELKHDTLLYAKQAYAEMGGGAPEGIPPPVPKGYVEADPIFWSRILALSQATESGLEARDFMPDEFKDRYDKFISATEFFKTISEKELKNEVISEADFEKLRLISRDLSSLVEPLSGKELTTKERRAGIVADIFTDVPDSKIVYEATGKPYLIYTAVKDINGTRLVAGLTYRHYETTDGLDNRWTDEEWQTKVYDGQGTLPSEDIWSLEIKK